MRKKTIVIDRQYGSGGREVGKILANELDIPFYDNELLMIAAEKYGLNPGELKDRDEKYTDSLLYNIAMLTSSLQNYNRFLQPYEIFQAECDTIKHLAANGPCVFIGRCADFVLKDITKPLNIFIYASSMDQRVKRAHEVDRVDMRNVSGYIKKKDMQRKSYYNFFTEREWGKLENYDLCLNTTALGYQGCLEVIKKALEY